MGDKTGIQWTDASWNPLTGCTKVSPGCAHYDPADVWPPPTPARAIAAEVPV